MGSSFKISVNGKYSKTAKFLQKLENGDMTNIITKHAEEGLNRLREYTPIDTGLASESWSYEIVSDKHGYKIIYHNSDIENGQNVVILLEYGHATKSGGWIEGIDIVDPALEPVFKQMIESIRREINNA